MAALGLLLLAVAAVVALAGVFANTGGSHLLGHNVNILGYHLSGSTGKLLLVGIVVGAVGMLGLNMLLAGLGRGLKKKVGTRRELKATRKQGETAAQERDRLAAELEQEHEARLRAEKTTVTGPVFDASRGTSTGGEPGLLRKTNERL